MKGFFCMACGDIRGLRASEVVECECGRCCGGWDDPQKGLAWFFATSPQMLHALGFHNGFLAEPSLARAHRVWEEAEGYAFLTYQSPVVRFIPGATRDTRWAIDAEGGR